MRRGFALAASVDSASDPRSEATAANLRAALLGDLDLSEILSTSGQTAPPDNPEPSVDELLAASAAPLWPSPRWRPPTHRGSTFPSSEGPS